MAQIKVSPDILGMEIKRLKRVSETLQGVLTEIRDIDCQMTETVSVEVVEKYRSDLKECENLPIKYLIEICNEYAEELQNLSKMMEEVENQWLNSFF